MIFLGFFGIVRKMRMGSVTIDVGVFNSFFLFQ